MSEVVSVSSEWLELREAEDGRARSPELAAAAATMLRATLYGAKPVVVHDLGSGTGSMMRWLAPRLPGPQTWVLHDWNADLIERAVDGARPVDADNRPVEVGSRIGDLAYLSAADLDGAALVTASALLDVLTEQETEAIVRACVATGTPALLTLSVTGHAELDPPDASDARFERAFNAHQVRVASRRQLLGRFGVTTARQLFEGSGWHVRTTDTVWRLGDHEPQLLGEWFDGWVDAAAEHDAELAGESIRYRELRKAQLQRGELSAVIHHADLLAWPR
jgi:hypothetical protein